MCSGILYTVEPYGQAFRLSVPVYKKSDERKDSPEQTYFESFNK